MLRSLPFSLSLSLSLSVARALFYISVNKVPARRYIYNTTGNNRRALYFSQLNWIQRVVYSQICTHTNYTLPIIIPLSSTDPKLPARTRVRASVFIRCRANAYVRWCVRTSQPHVYMQACTHARTHARTHTQAIASDPIRQAYFAVVLVPCCRWW